MGEVDLCGGVGVDGARGCVHAVSALSMKYELMWLKWFLLIFDNIYNRHEHKESMKYEARLSVNKLQYYKIVQASLNIYVISQRKHCTENFINLIMQNQNMSITQHYYINVNRSTSSSIW